MQLDAMRLQLLNDLRSAGNTIKKEDYGAITKTWKHKPHIEIVISLTGPGPVLLIGTDDEIFGYVSKGTPAHVILPRRKKALKFKSSYSAKSSPGVIGSKSGGAGGSDVFSAGVIHPGIKAREFEQAIQEKRDKWFKRQMEKSMKTGTVKSGYSQQGGA
jgi:hypothetical protein